MNLIYCILQNNLFFCSFVFEQRLILHRCLFCSCQFSGPLVTSAEAQAVVPAPTIELRSYTFPHSVPSSSLLRDLACLVHECIFNFPRLVLQQMGSLEWTDVPVSIFQMENSGLFHKVCLYLGWQKILAQGSILVHSFIDFLLHSPRSHSPASWVHLTNPVSDSAFRPNEYGYLETNVMDWIFVFTPNLC